MNWDDIRAVVNSNAEVAWSVLTSDSAVRVYVLVIASILIAVSFWQALQERTVLSDSTNKALSPNFRGPKPKSNKAKLKQRDLKLSRLKSMAAALLASLVRMMGFGVLVPVLFLLAGTTYYSWFDPNAVVLISQVGGTQVSNPSSWQLLLYVTDQVLRGGLFDVLEVFKVQVAGLSNNPVVLPYSIGLIAFRAAIDGYMIFALYFVFRTLVAMRKAVRDANAGLATPPSLPLPIHSNG